MRSCLLPADHAHGRRAGARGGGTGALAAPRARPAPPRDFIRIVEQTGLIGPLTKHVVEQAIAQCAAWRRAGKELTVSVNLSVRNLLDPDLPGADRQSADALRPRPRGVQLEITESMLMSDPDRSLVTLTRLDQLGVGLSVDDSAPGTRRWRTCVGCRSTS